MLVAIISFAAAIASIVLAVREVRGWRTNATAASSSEKDAAPAKTGRVPYRASGVAWALAFLAIQVFIGVWGALGLVQDEPIAPIIMNAVLTGCVYLSLARPRLRSRLLALFEPGSRWPHPQAACAPAMVATGIFATLALELPSNHNLLWMYPLCLLLEIFLVTAVVAGFFYLFQRRGAAPAIASFVFFAIGIAEYFVITFKSQPIQPGDLTAIATAAAVGGGYIFSITSYCLYGIVALALAMITSAYAALLKPDREHRTRKQLLVNLLVGVLCLGGVIGHVVLVDYYNLLRIQVYTWRPLESYYRQGFIPSFISSAQTIQPRKPEGYSKSGAQDLIDEYAASYDESAGTTPERTEAVEQFEDVQPSVIVVMNETFSDLSDYDNLHAGYEGPEFFNGIDDAVQRGDLYVSAYGGGTCNTEFEFLTGNSMAYLGNGVYPYTIYNLTHAENLAQQFSDLGYTTTAMHPNHATNWNRENVYRDFGFDEFLAIEDFEGADTLRGMVTDAETYDKIIEMLETDDDPQFIFDVTMQNHSGYDTGLIPTEMQTNYLIDGTYDPEVNEYLALIEESDRALEDFLGELEELDRPVVVVFFGDHQPFFPSDFNDAWFQGEDDATHSERLYHTGYVIWANYDLAGSEQQSQQEDISTNFLGAEVMNLIGAPLSDYQKAQLALRESMPAINMIGYQDQAGVWHLSSAVADEHATEAFSAAQKAREDLAKMQYLKLFDHGDSVYTKTLQGAANETNPNLAPGTTKIK
ncbi:LTA synthase family protein [uncultured Enorma sp.]|uniref:LTA synthase family protein n=1 Tax=uncultured Enorma sp. TaxID=1714346 RepID=UPI00265FB212|nr:LTA synthase family protein [uncultured Enorma sp.]